MTPHLDTKACTGCRETKPLAEFHRRAKSKGGHRERCKACTAEYKKAYRQANREKIAASKRAYRAAKRVERESSEVAT